ncbi:hypothetical protein [Micromonospora sp. NBC_01412]|uniref:pPIWI-associating nuclease domain-containing protein n=1 Tax=Micromonospora sp. NBC_01412 TaxID=2903590 RepID=UPI003243C6E8
MHSDEQTGGQVDQLLGWLEGVDQRLPRKYKGAWSAIGQRGPDWISQGANSGMELLDWTLRRLAPDEEVVAWQQGTGMYVTEMNPETGKPHRSLRCRYIAHSRGLPARALDDLIGGVSKATRILQKIKHADEEAMAEALRSSMVGVECCLMIMWRGA